MTKADDKPRFDLIEEADGYSVHMNWLDRPTGPSLRFPSRADALRWIAEDAEAWLKRSASLAKPAPLKLRRTH